MAPEEQTEDKPDLAPRKRKPARGLFLSLGVGSFLLTVSTILVLGALLFLASGRPIDAPGWLEARIESALEEELDGGALEFGAMQLVVLEGTSPSLRLSDVRLQSADMEEVISFSQMDTTVSLAALLKGELRPTHISIGGVFAAMRRSVDGQLTLSGGVNLDGPTQEAPSLAALAKGLDGWLLQPELDALEEVDVQALTLRFEDARTGRAWTLDGGRLKLTREGDALSVTTDLAVLSGKAGIATLSSNYTTTLGAPEAGFGVTVDNVDAVDIAAQGPAFAWLQGLRAPISGSLRTGLGTDGALLPLNATLSIDAGVLQPTEATRPIPFETAQAYFTFWPDRQELRFDELSVDSKWVTGRASGSAWLRNDASGQLADLVAQLSVDTLALNPLSLFDAPRTISEVSADLRMTLDPFRIELGEAILDLSGPVLQARGDLKAQPEGWQFALDGHLNAAQPSGILPWWPERFATKARKWVAENVMSGDMQQIDIALRGQPNEPVQTFLRFDYTEADVRFMKNAPPVTKGAGQFSLEDNRMVVSVDEGRVLMPENGAMDVAGTDFIIPDVRVKGGAPAEINLQSESPIATALKFIDLPPLNIMSKAGRGTDLAQGLAVVEGRINLSLRKGLKPDEVDYMLTGQLFDVASTQLVERRRLNSDALVFQATPDEIVVGGPGTLDGVPFEAAWQQIHNGDAPAQVSGSVSLTQATLDTFGVGLPPGTISGSARADMTVTLPKGGGAPRFSLSSNLRGATVRFPPLGWTKAARSAGELQVSGTLGQRPGIDRISLSAPGLSVTGGVTLNDNGSLKEARFSRVKVGNWLDAPVSLIGRGTSRPPAIRVTSGLVDLRRAAFGGSGSGGSRGPLTLSLDRLQVSDSIAFTNFAGQFGAGSVLDGRFTARVNGGAEVSGRVVPRNGRSAIQLESANAGGVLAAAGVLKQAVGGAMTLTLLPVVGAEGVFDGRLQVRSTRIKNAPVMADLLSAISVVGLLEQLSGNGILFNEVEADFRLTPSQVLLRSSSAVGPSMGLSMDGRYGLETQALDMQGVISPVYFLNAIGQLFSRRGEGLIGFNYRLRGSTGDPRVQVNPLSALTPGMFREIFRAPAPDIPAGEAPRALLPEDGESESTLSRAEQIILDRQRTRDQR